MPAVLKTALNLHISILFAKTDLCTIVSMDYRLMAKFSQYNFFNDTIFLNFFKHISKYCTFR